MNHTSGPWTIHPPDSNFQKNKLFIRDRDRRLIATIASDGKHGERLANAHLIAAGPELLEALKECLPTIESLDVSIEEGDEPIPLIAQVKSAIAKAEGRTAA